MACVYQNPISIEDAINSIRYHDYLLPALQRKYVWSSQQICVLFDSIMRGYPINTFMMWKVTKPEIKNDFKFYGFIQDFCQRLKDENPLVPTDNSFKDFEAIIDGQQRLTSLYLGLCSTYAYKLPRVNWPPTPDDVKTPPRKLYLDLLETLNPEDDELLLEYNFKFLTIEQYNQSLTDKRHHWYSLQEILKSTKIESIDDVLLDFVIPYLKKHDLVENKKAQKMLLKLYSVGAHLKLTRCAR